MSMSGSESSCRDNLSFSTGPGTCSDADIAGREEAAKLSKQKTKKAKDANRDAKRMKKAAPSSSNQTSSEEMEVWTPNTLVLEAAEWEGDLAVFIQLSIYHPELKIKTRRTPARTLVKASNQETEDAILSMTTLNETLVKFRTQVPAQTSTGVVTIAVPAVLLGAMNATTQTG